jgi:cell division protein FtsB
MNSFRLNLIIAFLFFVFIFLQYRLWFVSGGVYEMLGLKKTVNTQKNENDNLKKHNDDLLQQIKRLQNSTDATEAHARNELGMIKKDEKFYEIVN